MWSVWQFIQAFCIPTLHSDIPILNYAAGQLSGTNHNIILDNLVKTFPISQYVVDAATTNDNQQVKSQGNIRDVLGIIEGIRIGRTVLGGKVENIDNSGKITIDTVEGEIGRASCRERV